MKVVSSTIDDRVSTCLAPSRWILERCVVWDVSRCQEEDSRQTEQHRQSFKGGKYRLFQGSIREYALAGAKGVKREEVQDTFGPKVWGQIMEGLK